MERGDWHEAAYFLERSLKELSDPSLFPAEDFALYAFCLSRLGRDQALEDLSRSFGQGLSRTWVKWKGKSVSLSQFLTALREEASPFGVFPGLSHKARMWFPGKTSSYAAVREF